MMTQPSSVFWESRCSWRVRDSGVVRCVIALVLVCGVASGWSQGRSSTVPFGYLKKTLKGNAGSDGLELVGAPFVNPTGYQGEVGGVGAGSLTDVRATWVDSQFRPDSEVATHYVEIVLASDLGVVGSWANIAGNTTDTLEIEGDWSGVLTGGEYYVVRRHRTIADVFGADNEMGIGAGNVSNADSFAVLDSETKGYTSYYFKSGGFGGSGWRTTSNPFSNQGETPLLPHQGFYYLRNRSDDADLVFYGYLKLGRSKVFLKEGVNLVNLQTPLANQRELSQQGFNMTMGAVDDLVTIESGLDDVFVAGQISAADSIAVFDSDVSAYTSYYRKTAGFGGSGWRSSSNPFADRAGERLPGGASFFVRMKSGDRVWTRPQSFVLKK